MSTPADQAFSGLPLFAADMIMVDPPWKFENYSKKGEKKSAKAHYDCMDIEDIKALPVGHLASRNCVLLLWATNPLLPEALDTMKAWGFQYKSSAAWIKKTINGLTRMGCGYVCRGAHEPILIGTVGQPKIKPQISVIEGLAREHSRKPDEAYAWAEKMMAGDIVRYDLFSRETRPGWQSWGDEAGKFDEVEAA